MTLDQKIAYNKVKVFSFLGNAVLKLHRHFFS